MPYLVLAAGALMTIAGFYAVVTGYGVVQLEQGWSAVISGATLIAGGVVTMAMALLLRALNQIKAGLQVSAGVQAPAAQLEVPAGLGASSIAPAPAPHHDDLPAFAPLAAPVEPDPIAELPASPSLTAALEPAPVHPPPLKPEPLTAPKASLPRSPLFPAAPAPAAPPEPEPRPSDEFKPAAPTFAPVREPEHDRHDAPPPARPSEPHAQKPEPAPIAEEHDSPPMDDWLDRAFAEFDQTAPEPKHQPADHHPAPVHEPAYAEAPAAAEPAPVAAHEPPVPAPADLPAPTSAVIGRYEADGTSYVMYADGSIEAQSEAGVYRFASMAELKAFIET